ncbi:MAG: plastocyanin/azurin family copper-binding protein, partial [Solirubrobacteraceae bacterium]
MRRYTVLAVLLGTFAMALPAEASPETSSTVTAENIGGFYGEEHRWTPSQVTVSTVDGVTIGNPTEVKHGVHWISPPSTPTCDSGVPVGTTETASGTKWSGACKFTQPGAYTYYCTVHGAAMSGTITVKAPGTPTAATGIPTEVTPTGARLGGTVKPEGNATSYYFKYGLTSSMEQKIPLSPESLRPDFAEHVASATLTGLKVGTEYHVELVATYGVGETTVLGGEQTFKTASPPPPGPPSATTEQATAIGDTGVTLNGTVNPDGKPTSSFFEWGTSSSYGQVTAEAPAGEDHANHAASEKLAGLVAGKVYHFRLVAKNASEEVRGGDQMFTTMSLSSPPPEPAPPTTTTSPPPPPPTTTTPPEPPPGPPIVSGPLLAATQHGFSVRGSLDISPAGAGGRLEVDLLAK